MALPTATSYLSVADADAYFAASFNNAAWSVLTQTEKEIALQEATRWLETLCYGGDKCDAAQPLKWPRCNIDCCGVTAVCGSIPPALVQATAELALALHKNPSAIIGGGAGGAAGSNGPVKRQKLDALEVEYFDPRTTSSGGSTSNFSPSDPLVIQTFPWLKDLLKCWAEFSSVGGSGLVYRVRS
jgi:hypothetical protein